MAFIGQFTRLETVRLWAEFLALDGQPVEPTPATVTVELRQGAVQLMAPTVMTQLSPGSNIFYHDYSIGTAPTEGDVIAIYQGIIDTDIREGTDFFKIDLTKSHVLENRLGNMRIDFYATVVPDLIRKNAVGVLDYQTIMTKHNEATDWSSPTSTKTLYFYYQSLGDHNPVSVKEGP